MFKISLNVDIRLFTKLNKYFYFKKKKNPKIWPKISTTFGFQALECLIGYWQKKEWILIGWIVGFGFGFDLMSQLLTFGLVKPKKQ